MDTTESNNEFLIVWQPEKAIARLGGEKSLIHKLAVLFVRDSPDLITTIKNGIRLKHYDGAFTALHSLQGTSANFYASIFEAECAHLQQELKSNNWEEAEISFDELAKCYAELEKELMIFIAN